MVAHEEFISARTDVSSLFSSHVMIIMLSAYRHIENKCCFFPREELLDDNKLERGSSSGGLFWRDVWPSPAPSPTLQTSSAFVDDVGASFDKATL